MVPETIHTPSTDAAPTGAASAPPPASRRRGSPKLSHLAQSWGPVAILVVLVITFTIANSKFLTIDNIQTLAGQSAIPIVLATGLTFVILQGSIDLSLQGVMAVTSIVTALLVSNNVNGNELGYLGVGIALLAGLAFGLVNGLLYTRLRIPSLLVTIGTWFIGIGIASTLYPGQLPKVTDESIRAWSLDRWFGFNKLFFVALAVLLIGYVIQRFTRLGRYSYAIGGGEETARLSGIKLDRWKVGAFALAGLLSGLAGVMATSRLGVGSVQAGEGLLFPAVSAVVIGGTMLSGGRGGVVFSFVGVLTLTVLTNGMVLLGVDSYLQQAVQGAIIIIAVIGSTWRLRERLRVVK